MTSKQRQHAIIEVLSSGRKVTMRELAEQFGVSRRTIRLDIDYLSKLYKLEITKGRNGGVRMVEPPDLNHKRLSTKQQSVLEKLQATASKEDGCVLQSIILEFGWCG